MKQIKVNGLVVNIEKSKSRICILKFSPNGELFITAPKGCRSKNSRIHSFQSRLDRKQQTKIKKQYSAQKTLSM